jgi:hypothetical protein
VPLPAARITAATLSFTAVYFALGWGAATEQEADNGQDQENDEQDPGNVRRDAPNHAEPKQPGNHGYNKKNYCVS